jgi:hypothetical protein
MMVHCNPWQHSPDTYYGSYYKKITKYQIAGTEFSDPKKYGEREFLYMTTREIVSYEMHYIPRNNKEAALLLTRLEEDV